jgi:hypothetical protein
LREKCPKRLLPYLSITRQLIRGALRGVSGTSLRLAGCGGGQDVLMVALAKAAFSSLGTLAVDGGRIMRHHSPSCIFLSTRAPSASRMLGRGMISFRRFR